MKEVFDRGCQGRKRQNMPGRRPFSGGMPRISWALVLGFMAAAMPMPLFAGQDASLATNAAGPVVTLQVAQLQPIAPTGVRTRLTRRAMVIVIEENEAEHHSVTLRGLSQAVTSFRYDQLLPADIRPQVMPVIDASVNLARTFGLPAAALADEISRNLSRQVARMLGEYSATVAMNAGLPAGGCAREIFDTLARRGVQSSVNPMEAFLNAYGETGMAECLRSMAQPYYDTVVVVTDSGATFEKFSETLVNLHKTNHVIDLLINVHGCGQKSGRNSSLNNLACGTPRLSFVGGAAGPEEIRAIRNSNGGQALNINAVYQVACWGSDFNSAWTDLGAKAVNGARELNYYVLMSPFVFMDRFTRGNRTLKEAAQDAYLAERSLFNGTAFTARLNLRPFLDRTFPPPTVGIDLIGVACPGGTRAGCNWSFTPPYNAALNQALSTFRYGHDKNKPVNHSQSSARLQGNVDVRRALADLAASGGTLRVASSE
jgi:hypothetical protein